MTRSLPHLLLLLLLGASTGCQLVAPLPEADGTGGGRADTTSSSASASSAHAASGSSGATGSSVACEDPSCATYCSEVVETCSAHPQYQSLEGCCSACSVLGASAMSCRALPGSSVDANTCSDAGVIGPEAGQQCQGCAAVCTLFGNVCGDVEPVAVAACNAQCGGTQYPFDACAHLDSHAYLGCRLQNVMTAQASSGTDRTKACHDAATFHCDSHACGN